MALMGTVCTYIPDPIVVPPAGRDHSRDGPDAVIVDRRGWGRGVDDGGKTLNITLGQASIPATVEPTTPMSTQPGPRGGGF